MVVESTRIEALPNEVRYTTAFPLQHSNLNQILISILSHFLTRDLLPLTPTCRLFHDIILRILQHRLLEAASHKDHKLILECYHPSAKFYTPYLHCDYLGTPGLNLENERICGDETTGSLEKLSKLYSYFRPLKPSQDRPAQRPHPAGGWPALPPIGLVDKHEQYVCQDIHLDSHELFCQLVTVTNLVKLGPKPGVFKSSVNIGEGLTRVWRDWLSDCVAWCNKAEPNEREKRLLWSDSGNHVGLRINVEERPEIPAPVGLRRDEDPPVSYTLQYEGQYRRSSLDIAA